MSSNGVGADDLAARPVDALDHGGCESLRHLVHGRDLAHRPHARLRLAVPVIPRQALYDFLQITTYPKILRQFFWSSTEIPMSLLRRPLNFVTNFHGRPVTEPVYFM